MFLYLLRRNGEPDHDMTTSVVVAALTSAQARQVFTRSRYNGPGYEGPEVWLDPSRSSARRIGTASPGVRPGVLIRDYLAG